MDPRVVTHYERLAKSYDRFLQYSPDFIRTLTSRMIQRLDLRPSDRLVDLGCGTCLYSSDIVAQLPLEQPVVAVDPFPAMLDGIPPEMAVERMALDALEFSKRSLRYDKLLMKEAVHHVVHREELFAGLREQLTPGGRLLLVHVPPKLDYPLFSAALERCERWHADPVQLQEQLRSAGFQVEASGLDYPHRIPVEHYLEMVRSRYMSVLSTFSDEELERGLEEMRAAHEGKGVLEFTDHFDYISATLPA